MRAMTVAGAALLAVAMAAPARAEAQFGGLIRSAGQRLMENEVEQRVLAPTSGPTFDEDVVEMTPAVLDQLPVIFALSAEIDAERVRHGNRQQEFEAKRAAHEACTDQLETELESTVQRLATKIQAAQARGDFDEMAAVGDTLRVFYEKAMASAATRCGTPPQPEDFRSQEADLVARREAALGAAGLSAPQVDIIVERAVPFCRTIPQTEGQDFAAIPGRGRGIFFVYSAVEVQALTERCPTLLPLLQAEL